MQPPAFSQQPESTGHQDVFEVQWRMRQLFQQLDDAQKSQKPNSKKTIEQMRLCYQMSELQDRLQKAKQAGGVNGRKASTGRDSSSRSKERGRGAGADGRSKSADRSSGQRGRGGQKRSNSSSSSNGPSNRGSREFSSNHGGSRGGLAAGAAASSMPTGAVGSQIHSNSQQLRMSKGVKKAQVRLFKRFEALIEGRIHASAEEKKLQKLRQSLEDDLADCLKMKKRSMQRSRPLSASSATVAVHGAARTMKSRGPASRPMSAGPCGPSMVDVDLEPDEPQDDPQAHLRGDTVADLKTQKLLRNTTSQIDSALFKHYQQIQKMKSQVRKQISKNRPVSAVTRSPLDEDVEELQTPPGADGRREPVFGNMENCTQPPLHDNFLQEPGEHADGEPHPHVDHGQHGVALTAAEGSLSRSSSAANDSSNKSVLPPSIAVHQQKPRPYSAHPKSFQDPPAQGEASSANNSGVAAAGSSLFNTTLTAAGFLSSKKDSGKKRPWTSAGGRGGLTFGPGGVEKGSSNPNSRSASNEKKKMKRPGAANQKWRRAQGFMNTSTAYDSSTTTSTAANGGSTTAAEDSSGASFRLKNFQFPSNSGGAVGEVDVDQFGFPVLRAGTTVSQSYDGRALKAALVREQGAPSADVLAALPTEHADADGEAPEPAERSALPRGGGRPRAYSSTDVSGAPAGAAAAKGNPRHLAVVDAKTGEVRIASTGGSSALPGNRSSSGKRRKNSAGTRNSSAKSGGGGGTGERGGWSATSEALRRRYGKDCPIGLVPGEQLNAGDSGYASDEAFIMDDADDGYASDTSEKIREATCVKLRKRGWSAARVRSAQPVRAGAAGGIAAAGEQGVGGAEDPDKKRKREEAGAATGTDIAQPVGAAGAAGGSCEGKTKAPGRGGQGAAAGDDAFGGAAQKYAAEGARDLRGFASSTSELLQHVPSPNRRRRIDPLSNRVPRLDMAATESFKEDVSYPVLTTATTVTTDDEGLQITRLNGRASLSVFSGTKRVQMKAAGVDIAPAAGLLPADAAAQSQQDQFSAAATTDPAYLATDEVQLQRRHAFSTTSEDVRSCIKQRRLLQRAGSGSSFGLSFTTGVDINPSSVVASGVGTATLSAASASGELVQPAPRPPIFAKEVLHTLDRHAAEAKLDLETYLLHHDADKQTPFDRIGSVVGGLNAKTLASRVEEKVEQALRTSSGKPAPGNKTSSNSTNNMKTKEEGAEVPIAIAVEAAAPAGDAVSGSLTTGTAVATSTASGSSSGAGTVAAAVAAAPAAPPHQVKLPIKNSPPERENHYAQRERERLRNSKSLSHAPTSNGRSSSSSSSSTSSSFLEIPMPEVLLPVPAAKPASIVEDELSGGATHRQHDQEAQQLLVGAGGSAGVLLPERYTRQAAPIRWSQDFPDDPLNQEALAELRRSKEQPQLERDEVDTTGSLGGPRGSKNLPPPNRSRAGSTASSNGGGSSSFLEREGRAPSSMSKLPVTNKPRYGYLPPTMWDGLDVVEEISMEVEVPGEKIMRTDPAAQRMLQNLADSYSDPFSRAAVPNNRSVNPEQAGSVKNAARAVVPSSTTSTTSSSGGSLSYGGGRSSSASSSSGSCGTGQSQPRLQQVPKQQEQSREVEKTGKKPLVRESLNLEIEEQFLAMLK